MNETDDELDGGGVFPENNDRVEAQKALDIKVVIGNPPWSVGQDSGNDNNQNLSYPTLDARIDQTYAARSAASLTKSLHDSYIRAIRWASDRIGNSGIVAFVSNGAFIDSNSADGMRKALAEEFSSIYVLNLRGNQRTSGDESRREGGKVFGAGSRATVAIYLFIKNPKSMAASHIHYFDIGDYLTREEKLASLVAARTYTAIDWTELAPNDSGDWVNQRDAGFEAFTPLAAPKRGSSADQVTFFTEYSRGVLTSRDAWVYNFNSNALLESSSRMIEAYNSQVAAISDQAISGTDELRNAVNRDPRALSWDGRLEASALRGKVLKFRGDEAVRIGSYRPFTVQYLYLDKELNNSVYQMPRLFPKARENFGFYITAQGSGHPFSLLACRHIPDIALWGSGSGQFFPRYSFTDLEDENALFATFEEGESPDGRFDNVTDEILADYQTAFGPEITKDEIFFYVYGILHSPDYREQFAADLKKMLPRIPKVKSFTTFSEAGRQLMGLHLDYENAEPYQLEEQRSERANYRVEKMRYAKTGRVADKTTVIYNSDITLSGIPEEAHEYMLGSRSAIDWIVERYQVKTDKASGIVNDPNDWADEQGNPRYILDLLARIVTVSVETVRIVKSLPGLDTVDET